MPTYDLSGVEVEFPYEAYDCQLEYMQSVVNALEAGENALLESPTGTGKTLCLLCAALGWRRHRQRLTVEARTSWEAQANPDAPSLAQGCPRIWYSSRTHSQIKQVVRELKRTTYRPSSVVLGSREHFCIHSSVSRHSGARQNAMCKRARDENRCHFYSGLRTGRSSKVNTSGLDIEEIVSACKEANICPFYKCREEAQEVDLLFIPYDYLINPQTRESLQVSLKNSILIFDEGHNIEKSCESVASFELTAAELAGAISEIDDALDLLEQDMMTCEEALGDMSGEMLMQHLLLVKKNLLALEDSIYSQRLEKDAATDRTLFKAPGSQILQIFSQASLRGDGITEKDAKRITSMVRKAITVLTFSMESTANSGGLYLDKLQAILVAMFRSDPGELDKNYQVLIYEEDGDGAKRGTKRKSVDFFSNMGPTGGDREEAKRTLCLWCLSCSVALRELASREVRSMIITSGTLSPLEGTAEDFGVPFPVVLENKHVIDPKRQLWGAVLTAGPSNVRFDASFDGRNDPNYLRDLGNAVARFAACVPDGVLLAFQSYARKEAVLQAWRQSGVYDEIQKQKPVFEEPKYQGEMRSMFEKYKTALTQPPTAARPMGGAILAAVCRGKLCEGIDFSDRECRMVIVVGIPYPAKNDLRVLLKQGFLDSRGSEGDGRKWYIREAVRAVNQTLGRVIRHRNDFGGVLLCDDRYASNGRLSNLAMQLPSWLRPQVGVLDSFESALRSCRHFFGVAAPTLKQEKPAPAEIRAGAQAHTQAIGSRTATPAAAAASASRPSASVPSAAAAAGAQTGAAGIALSALGSMWKDRRKLRLLSRPSTLQSGAASSASVNVFAKKTAPAEGLENSSHEHRPSASDAGASARGPATPQVPATSPPAGAFRRAGAAPAPQRVALYGSTSEPSPSTDRWLRAAEALLPRMEFDVVRQQLRLLLRQADEALASSQAGVDVEERLQSAMTSVAEALLPEFCFDTPEEKRKRDNLVKECMLLLPRLLRPLWRAQVEDILKSQQKPSFPWAR
mmetsp:Transcript_9336/g.15513  ORF Transcript_9336/g.15513 Transcript_9336/m.15513 type:complete len:1023 (-) Transcript_9336:43-3111(-)